MLVDFVLVKFFTKKRIPYNEISKIRGYIGNKFIEHPEFHNHLEKNFNYSYPSIQYVNKLMTHSWGQKVIRFYDLDGNLIEVGTPM